MKKSFLQLRTFLHKPVLAAVLLLAVFSVFPYQLHSAENQHNDIQKYLKRFKYFAQCIATSNMKPYGEGKDFQYSANARTLRKNLSILPDWHCGQYALWLGVHLPPESDWVIYGLRQHRPRANHAVVQVTDGGRIVTYDPTQGILYLASVEQLISGKVDYDKVAIHGKPTSPRLERYRGKKLFLNARVMGTAKMRDIENRLLPSATAVLTDFKNLGAGLEHFDLCVNTSCLKPYGAGSGYRAASDVKQTIADLESLENWHSGLYAMYFGLRLLPKTVGTVYALHQPQTQSFYTVIQIDENGRSVTYDPAQGIAYRSSVQQLIAGTVDYEKIMVCGKTLAPEFEYLRGEKFFKNARITTTLSMSKFLVKKPSSGSRRAKKLRGLK